MICWIKFLSFTLYVLWVVQLQKWRLSGEASKSVQTSSVRLSSDSRTIKKVARSHRQRWNRWNWFHLWRSSIVRLSRTFLLELKAPDCSATVARCSAIVTRCSATVARCCDSHMIELRDWIARSNHSSKSTLMKPCFPVQGVIIFYTMPKNNLFWSTRAHKISQLQ